MSKVITFSQKFPSYHQKAGQPTYFVEQFYNSIYLDNSGDWSDAPGTLSNYVIELEHTILGRKHHTIRGGNRFKVGDKFSPRVWGNDVNPKSGRSGPYHSKQIILCEDLEIKKVWDFEIKEGLILINNEVFAYSSLIDLINKLMDLINKLALNDGLSHGDLLNWFKYPKPFKGQIICWNNSITY